MSYLLGTHTPTDKKNLPENLLTVRVLGSFRSLRSSCRDCPGTGHVPRHRTDMSRDMFQCPNTHRGSGAAAALAKWTRLTNASAKQGAAPQVMTPAPRTSCPLAAGTSLPECPNLRRALSVLAGFLRCKRLMSTWTYTARAHPYPGLFCSTVVRTDLLLELTFRGNRAQ